MKQETFTNGVNIDEWLESLTPDDRIAAIRCIRHLIAENQPLNQLQVKIHMSDHRPVPTEVSDDLLNEEEALLRELSEEIEAAEAEEAVEEGPRNYYDNPLPPQQPSKPDPPVGDIRRPEAYGPFQNGQQTAGVAKTKSNFWKYACLAIVALLVVMFATNPTFTDHKRLMSQTVTNAATQTISQKLQETGIGGMFGGMVGNLIGSMAGNILVQNVIDSFLQNNLEYHNYLFFSTCTVEYADKTHTISLGILNKVFTFDEADIDRAIESDLSSDEDTGSSTFFF